MFSVVVKALIKKLNSLMNEINTWDDLQTQLSHREGWFERSVSKAFNETTT